ncbi:MAG: ABC-2 family transporter protein [Chloroflexi bacterium]|nr:ABC-2 family transporter protein [Chloroflexota bacterium]
MKRYFDFYRATMKLSVLEQLQYPVANYFYMIGMIAEPVIYMVVWSAVANQQGGMVGGYTPGAFAAYYIVWTLVRNMNIVFTPYGWEWRIREGQLSMSLLRPIHPLHGDVAYFAGWKVVVILLWLPLALILSLIFKPELNPTLLQGIVFFFAIWMAYLIRTMTLSLLGMVTFWTTRVSALFELYFAAELILSGRLVPLSLMPDWVQRLAWFFPFRWAFGFPIEALVGSMTATELLTGLGMQLAWILFGVISVSLIWKVAIRRFSAVGG